ncbi:DUF6082 family protein [Actinoplanes sp. NPDC051851]|uniref:DUF6082 family protein n=1 Tax=Actinoplanes sp. NPDC051851 TaxID=3154753 RepID=UPI00341805E5
MFGLLGGTLDDWNRLSAIGQAYGSVSAIISAVALAGVILSIALQQRQTSVMERYSLIEQHFTIMRAAMDDPDLMECWGTIEGVDPVQKKRHAYINTISNYWFTFWDVHKGTSSQIRANFALEIFSTEAGLEWWRIAREVRIHTDGFGKQAEFDAIVESEYQKALKSREQN